MSDAEKPNVPLQLTGTNPTQTNGNGFFTTQSTKNFLRRRPATMAGRVRRELSDEPDRWTAANAAPFPSYDTRQPAPLRRRFSLHMQLLHPFHNMQ